MKSIFRAISIAVTGVLPAISIAQSNPEPKSPPAIAHVGSRSIVISTPEMGPGGTEFLVRPLPSTDAKVLSSLPLGPFKDKKFTVSVDTSTLGKAPRLAIDDTKRGNTAIVVLPKIDTVDLHSTDFDRVHRAEVKVTFDGKPVQAAQVRLESQDGKSDITKTIDPSAKGIAAFEDVLVGKNKLTVTYGDKLSQTQDVPISTDHVGTVVLIPVAVSTKVATLDTPDTPPIASAPGSGGAAPTSGSQTSAGGVPTSPAAAPQSGGSGFAGLLGTIIGMGVVGAGIYFLYKWAQSGGMAATLKKAGIEVSGPQAPPDPSAPWNPNAPVAPIIADPASCQFCGQKKDGNGNCACSIGAAAVSGGGNTAYSATPVAVSQPRLVATAGVHSGKVIPVDPNGPPVSFGRDPGNTVILDNDTTVSRRHAAIRAEAGGYIVSDEGSSNGVYVNGVKISGPQQVRPGDEIQIGNTRFRFEL